MELYQRAIDKFNSVVNPDLTQQGEISGGGKVIIGTFSLVSGYQDRYQFSYTDAQIASYMNQGYAVIGKTDGNEFYNCVMCKTDDTSSKIDFVRPRNMDNYGLVSGDPGYDSLVFFSNYQNGQVVGYYMPTERVIYYLPMISTEDYGKVLGISAEGHLTWKSLS